MEGRKKAEIVFANKPDQATFRNFLTKKFERALEKYVQQERRGEAIERLVSEGFISPE